MVRVCTPQTREWSAARAAFGDTAVAGYSALGVALRRLFYVEYDEALPLHDGDEFLRVITAIETDFSL